MHYVSLRGDLMAKVQRTRVLLHEEQFPRAGNMALWLGWQRVAECHIRVTL